MRIIAATLSLITALSFLSPPSKAEAVVGSDFIPGFIMSDSVFYNGYAMSAGEIQNFLNSKVPRCALGDPGKPKGGIFIYSNGTRTRYADNCLKDYVDFVPGTAADSICKAIPAGRMTAAQMIQLVGNACNVSQKVLIVIIQKEQSLITDAFPDLLQYERATGFNCPDTAPCSTASAGFFKQVYSAARQMQVYGTGVFNWYPVGAWSNILYQVGGSCGSSPVFIRNRATAALYYYTPYQPNAAALNNLYGTGDACSAYGNRNFWRLFNDWFGNTLDAPPPVHWFTPERIADTRPGYSTLDGRVQNVGPVAAGSTIKIPVLGRGGVPSAGVGSVVVNVTAVNPGGNGHLTVYPTGETLPNSSNVNFVAGQIVPNLVITKVGSDGTISILNGALNGQTHLIVDVAGWLPPTGTITSFSPSRIVDTRTSYQTVDGQLQQTGPLAAGGDLRIPVLGRAGIPASGVGSVVLNVTSVNSTSNGHLTAYPTGENVPNASNLNFVAGQTVPNMVVVKVGADGSVTLRNGAVSGATDIVVDVSAWLPSNGDYHPVSPVRIADSRPNYTTIDGQYQNTGRVSGGSAFKVKVLGRGGIPTTGVTAVAVNVTVVRPTFGGNLTAYPGGEFPPNTSNLNFVPDVIVPNMVILRVGSDGTIVIDNKAIGGSADVVVDIAGWFEN
ncbi:hypothetical protein [Aurantimicrobium minutum]|uniref:Uncharacterized protein n=1 Tax=Aurantimicrobium minutum TaxID=708131 RepID=A0A182C1R9_9MICO|nr:hypothetical protein [Aurantimicrobium minutum]BAU98717.1 Uncharacterized protein AUMI_11750 [Aurantimicrobium minutum]